MPTALKGFIRQAYYAIAPRPRIPQSRGTILMYHSIAEDSSYFSTVAPNRFEQQMAYVACSRRPVVSLVELVDRLRSGRALEGCIAITFDDGYRDNYTRALPILKKFGFPATIFLVTDRIGGVNEKCGLEYLRSEDISSMDTTGLIDFGAHTRTHPHLTKLSEVEVRKEIDTINTLKKFTNRTISVFAYPYGNEDPTIRNIVRGAGFNAAVAVSEHSVGPECDLYRLPRIAVDRTTSMSQFKGKLSGAVDRFEKMKRVVKTVSSI